MYTYQLLFLLVFINFALLQKTKADVLLIPEKAIKSDEYKTICNKNKYSCFPQAFPQVYESQSSYLEDFLNDFDLDNQDYLKSFNEKINTILSTESISTEQLNRLLLAIDKVYTTENNRKTKIKILLSNLQKLKMYLENENFSDSDTGLYVLGKMINNNERNQKYLKNTESDLGFKFKTFVVSYNEYSDESGSYPYLKGTCDNPQYDKLITSNIGTIHLPYFAFGCNFSERYKWGGHLLGQHFKQHKTKYYWAVGIIAGLVFAKKYDVAIEIN